MADATYALVFEMRDTDSTLGPYAVKDLVKMHGHACDGLMPAACAMKTFDRIGLIGGHG